MMDTKMLRIDRLVFAMTISRKRAQAYETKSPAGLLSLIGAVAGASVNATTTYYRDVLPIHTSQKP